MGEWARAHGPARLGRQALARKLTMHRELFQAQWQETAREVGGEGVGGGGGA